jgi:predicted PurR-regulated permease PerM
MDYNYNYSYITQTQYKRRLYAVIIIFFLLGIFLILFIAYLIYKYVLKENQQTQITQPVQNIIENIKKIIKPPEYDLNIDDILDQDCIQKRKIYDSDFDRTTYSINDNEIIYF